MRQQPAPRRVEPRAVRAGEEVLEPRRVDVGVLFESKCISRRVGAVPEDASEILVVQAPHRHAQGFALRFQCV